MRAYRPSRGPTGRESAPATLASEHTLPNAAGFDSAAGDSVSLALLRSRSGVEFIVADQEPGQRRTRRAGGNPASAAASRRRDFARPARGAGARSRQPWRDAADQAVLPRRAGAGAI